jgi:hypothetical protein
LPCQKLQHDLAKLLRRLFEHWMRGAQLLRHAGKRFQAPGPSSASMNSAGAPSTSPAAIFSADAAILAASGEGPGLYAGSSVASNSPPGSARIRTAPGSPGIRVDRNNFQA